MTDRVKQTVFDILSNRVDFQETTVLDLFAGSGSLGLEALSRGAEHVTFVDNSRSSLEIIRKNVASVECETRTTAHLADVFWYLKNAQKSFDLIFADPPYKLPEIGSIPDAIARSRAAREGTFVVMEHSRESIVEVEPSTYEITRKQFGQTTVLILKCISKEQPTPITRNPES